MGGGGADAPALAGVGGATTLAGMDGVVTLAGAATLPRGSVEVTMGGGGGATVFAGMGGGATVFAGVGRTATLAGATLPRTVRRGVEVTMGGAVPTLAGVPALAGAALLGGGGGGGATPPDTTGAVEPDRAAILER